MSQDNVKWVDQCSKVSFVETVLSLHGNLCKKCTYIYIYTIYSRIYYIYIYIYLHIYIYIYVFKRATYNDIVFSTHPVCFTSTEIMVCCLLPRTIDPRTSLTVS